MNKEIRLIQKYLINNNYKFYLITNSDIHLNESPNSDQKDINNLTGFDCSSGYLLILTDKIVFFTDSRYMLAAKNFFPKSYNIYNIKNTSIPNYIKGLGNNFNGMVDPKLISISEFLNLNKILSDFKINIYFSKNDIFMKRYYPNFQKSYAFSLPINYIPRNYIKNLSWIKNKLKSQGLLIWNNAHLAYLLNIRSFELANSTKPFAGMFVSNNNQFKPIIISKNIRLKNILKIKNNFQLMSFSKFKSFLKTNNFKKIELDFDYTNYEVYKSLKSFLTINQSHIDIDKYQSKKTLIEQKNIYSCHIEDGLALTKFIIQLKTKKIIPKNEYSIFESLYNLRKEGINFFRNSFDYICAFDSNAAIVHYRPLPYISKKYKNQKLLLLDSGAHYLEGTTDVTRVIKICSPIKEKIKNFYTYLLKSLLRIENIKFSKNLLSSDIDNFIRSYLAKHQIYYGHGTGHGVGYFNDVHEKYPIISSNSHQKILNGNFFSIEPGFYVSNEFGLRIENLYFAIKSGNFFKLKNITLVPYELDLINWNLITSLEKSYIKRYHQKIFDIFKGQLNTEYKEYFKKKLINKI